MTVALASQKTIEAKGIPSASYSLTPQGSSTYTRPSDWLALPTLTASDQKFVGLFAVFNYSTNYVALSATVSGGSFQVDWGDGTAPQTYATGTIAQYNYTFSSLPSGTLTSGGYRQAIITVTPVGAGLLSVVDLNKKFVNVPVLSSYVARWLDIAVASANLTSFIIAGNAPVVSFGLLEQVSIIKTTANNNFFFANMFYNLSGLQSIPILAGPDNWNDARFLVGGCFKLVNFPSLPPTNAASFDGSQMFQQCYSLEKFPVLPAPVNLAVNMFNGCASMTVAPAITFQNSTNLLSVFSNCTKLIDASQVKIINLGASYSLNSFFSGCVNLVNAPYLNTKNATTFESMFFNCVSLKTVPFYDSSTVTIFATMFSGCRALKTVPFFNTSNATNITSMFQNCSSLTEVPTFNFEKVTACNGLFQGCSLLTSVPPLNLGNAASFINIFNGCNSLQIIGDLISTKNTILDSAFLNCNSLKTAPAMDTSNVTTFISTFNGCTILESIPLYDSSKSVNFNSMFAQTQTLETVPLLNLSNATQVTSMFNGSKIISAPDFNTANCTNFTNMFNNCALLKDAPNLNTIKALNISTMFTSCPTLNSIPAFNCANVTTAPSTFTSGSFGLSSVQITGLKLTHSYASSNLGKPELETICTNLGIAATTQTLTISSNPGATTVYTVSAATVSLNSIDASTINANIVPGMYAYGNGVNSFTANFSSSTSEFIVSGFGTIEPDDGIMFGFTAFTVNPGLAINQTYYSVNSRAGGYFKLSLTPGGAPITLTATSTGTITYANYVTAVSTNNVILKLPGTSGSGLTVTFRALNTHAARIKNWTVTG